MTTPMESALRWWIGVIVGLAGVVVLLLACIGYILIKR